MPDSVIGSCQVDKVGTGLLFRFECILNALREQSDLIHGGSSASKTRLFPWEQRVNKRFDAGVDKSLENLVGNTEQGERTIAPWVLYRFCRLGTAITSALLQILGILSGAGRKIGSHVAKILSRLQHGLLAPGKWNQVPQRTPDGRNSRRHSQDVMDQPSKGQTLPVKRAEMSADSHLRISRV